MLNLSIMPLEKEHIEAYCENIIDQQCRGISTHAMLMMKFNPEGTPPVNKAEAQCKIYDQYREILDKAGAKHGVLVQATLGHITVPYEPYPFQPSVSLVSGEDRVVTCCPMDPNFQSYIKEQMKILAQRRPAIVMLDDDLGLLYKPTKGCACKYHMAEFNRRAGTNMTREELYAHTQGNSEADKRYTQIYVDVQRDGIVSAVKAMREGLDEIDPTIQGIVSGIYVTTFCEFSGDTARVFAGKGNPSIVRLNGGPYAKSSSGRTFTESMFRAAILKENVKDQVDIFLAETDTCPQNRYSTSAALLHGHFTASILEGATGAKHWITRLGKKFEPKSGIAYRQILSKYSKFYEKLTEYAARLKPFGCRIPLTRMQNYGFIPAEQGLNLSPWSTCVLERFGLPLYFGNNGDGAVFIDDFSVDGFGDEAFKTFFAGTVVLSAGAAEKLLKRGFEDYIGVKIEEWNGAVISGETLYGNEISTQYGKKAIVVCRDGVEELSHVFHRNVAKDTIEILFPGVTRYNNPLGGETIVFCGTPDMPFLYKTAFSLLNETRKRQFIDILSRRNHIPLYYPEDGEIYLRAGYLENNEIMAAVFNLGFDVLEDIALVCDKKVEAVEMLNPDGSRSECAFKIENGIIRVNESLNTLIPAILFVKTK
ncbi:MAG: hypothetical protein E7329_10505 [Clostridiales bacterium]|nr:hypothetical protein [Clostridiales bacterium]